MKKAILFTALAVGAMTASAQAVQQPKFFDNWSVGIDGGVTTPIENNAFFGSMRGIVGLHLDKQITPAFALGVEGQGAFNTSSWAGKVRSHTMVDNSYVGAYGAVDLFNLFGGYQCKVRPFSIDAVLGAGWGHDYQQKAVGQDANYFVTKAGLNFNFNVSDKVSISIKPSVAWNMNQPAASQTAVAYNSNGANFNLLAGVTYHMGGHKFECVRPYDQAEVDALNGQINDLRAQLNNCANNAANWEAKAKEVSNNLNSVRFVFFRVGSSAVTSDQQPNVEMIADYMKNHPNSKVVIKGYASPEGNEDANIKLAQKRAESVKTSLVNKYKIAESRISAEGAGIGNMFDETSWNRVSVCTIDESK
jgi:outer membrane protein OmpA-like peptidoglycan-associated protein